MSALPLADAIDRLRAVEARLLFALQVARTAIDAALVDATARREFWVNVYPGQAYQARDTKSECDQTAGGDRLACVRVPYHDGQFDEDRSVRREYCPRCEQAVRLTDDGEACAQCKLVL